MATCRNNDCCCNRIDANIMELEAKLFFLKNPKAVPFKKKMRQVAERIVGMDWGQAPRDIYSKLYRIARTWDGHSRIRA